MRRRNHGEKRDIVGLLAAFGPVLALVACAAAPATVKVPMLSATDAVFDAGSARGGDHGDGGGGGDGKDGGAVELEPSPPSDAFACRRDVACRASVSSALAPGAKRPASASSLPSPFEQCPLQDDKGRHFSAKETRDARLTDAARCCYVSFVDCVRGAAR